MALAYLKGGPCDGETRTITPSIADTARLICKNSYYTASNPTETHNGNLVFNYFGPVPPPTTGGVPAHLHHGWADLQRSVNRDMPAALGNAKRSTREVLRTVARARRVRL